MLDLTVMKNYIRMADDAWQQGWHERNGGNITYRLTKDEVAQMRPFFDENPREWVNMGVTGENLASEYFIFTGSGKYMRNVTLDPQDCLCVVEINEAGDSSRALWKSATECPVVFPSGVGVVPWKVPGGADIVLATCEKMKDYEAAVWAHHGLFVSGPDFDTTFGLMHTIEKSAQIRVLAHSCGPERQAITDDDLSAIAKEFGVTLREEFLS